LFFYFFTHGKIILSVFLVCISMDSVILHFNLRNDIAYILCITHLKLLHVFNFFKIYFLYSFLYLQLFLKFLFDFWKHYLFFIQKEDMCIHCLSHFSPPPPNPSLSNPHPLLLCRTCSVLFSNFVEEKT
jgi:hypothetical protein